MRLRKLSAGLIATIASGALLGSVALAEMDASPSLDTDDNGGTTATASPAAAESPNASPDNAHGLAVSTFAKTTTLTGEAKGDAISALASGGRAGGEDEDSEAAEAAEASHDEGVSPAASPLPTPKGAAISAAAKARH